MDFHNNLNRQVTIDKRQYKIVGVSKCGKMYMLCDAYGRETIMPVSEVIGRATSLA